MAKKDFSSGVENLFEHHAKTTEIEPEITSDKSKPAAKDEKIPTDAPAAPAEAKQDNPSVNTRATVTRRAGRASRVKTRAKAKEEGMKDEPEVFMNRTYSISRKVINAITDFSYHNRMDKNSIINAALKEFLGEYYDNAEN